jgi:hypothetical protein
MYKYYVEKLSKDTTNEFKPIVIHARLIFRISFFINLLFFIPTFIGYIYCSIILLSYVQYVVNKLFLWLIPLPLLVASLLLLFLDYVKYFYSYIIITKDGLVYRNQLYYIETDWQNVVNITRIYYLGWKTLNFIDRDMYENLVLSQSKSESVIGQLNWFIQATGMSKHIPINHFANNWRSSELGRIILENAIYMNKHNNET